MTDTDVIVPEQTIQRSVLEYCIDRVTRAATEYPYTYWGEANRQLMLSTATYVLEDNGSRYRCTYGDKSVNVESGMMSTLNETIEYQSYSLELIAHKIISNASSSNQAISLLAETYLETVANSIFNSEPSKQFVKLSDLLSQFELNKTLRT